MNARIRSLLVGAFLIVGVVGCAQLTLRTASAPTDACDMSLASGELVSSRQSGLALRQANGPNLIVLWPFGYSAGGFAGSLELRDPTGVVIAREGDRVEMSGGAGADGVFAACAGTIKLLPTR